ncbi:hypothetical protein Vretimale_8588 [Volvox reticuliferus]|uniref:Pherophorin domain-containing protein n=2 Tax=Volvox reticuliferus TaxID=1737510 RepID=A0A8J4FLD5_9CHLO|nr:hypothetical protein Vretifemale_6514 [Volvox reticuliferus]GIM03935.1 hypothetical protein Vretimale_8588 [Volvox reticuliferus]
MNAALNASNISPIPAPFAPNSTTCFDDTVLTCGSFNGADVSKLESLFNDVSGLLSYFIEVASSGDICNPKLEGYSVLITTDDNSCLDISQSASCFLPREPFPNCTCDTTQGVLPFVVSPTYYPRASPFFGPSTTEYCFTISTLPPADIVNSTCYQAGDKLAKIEWYADESLKSMVKGYTITPFGGPSKKVSPSWGASGVSTLKVTLNWNDTEANGGLVCVAIMKAVNMETLCKGAPGQCYASVFNRDNSDYCCPIFRTGP